MLSQPNKSYFLFFRVRFIALLVTVSITMMDDLLFYISCTSIPLKSIFVFTACSLSPPRFLLPPRTHMALYYMRGELWGKLIFRNIKWAEDGCLFGLSLTSLWNEAHCHIYDFGKSIIYWRSHVGTRLLPDMWSKLDLCFVSLASGSFHLSMFLYFFLLSSLFLHPSLPSLFLPVFMVSPFFSFLSLQ